MRFSRSFFVLAAILLASLALGALPAIAQDDDYEYKEPEPLELRGVASGSFVHSFQETQLDAGSFSDGNGTEVMAGFTAGEYLAFLLSWEWQVESDYNTHFVPVNVRMMSPSLFDRARLYGQFGIGLFFSRLSGEFDRDNEDNERAAAARVGGGVEVGITEDVSAIVFGNYLWGLGSANDYEYGTVGLGLQYKWDL